MNRDAHQISGFTRVLRAVATMLCLSSVFAAAQSPNSSHTITTIVSTVPFNGDVNPYGIVVVPATTGNLSQGTF